MAAMRLLSGAEAAAIDAQLFSKHRYTLAQLMELAGQAVAHAVARAYPAGRCLVLCGPGNNGGDGLVAARHLVQLGFRPAVHLPRPPKTPFFEALVQQCLSAEVEVAEELPSMDGDYDVIVDALFGFSFRGPVRSPYDRVLSRLKATAVPILSVDVPSGWDVELGDTAGHGLRPDVLLSLTAPKRCAQHFAGRLHFLGPRPPLAAQLLSPP